MEEEGIACPLTLALLPVTRWWEGKATSKIDLDQLCSLSLQIFLHSYKELITVFKILECVSSSMRQ